MRNQRHLLTEPEAVADFLSRFKPDDLGSIEHRPGLTFTTGHVDGATPVAVLRIEDARGVALDVAVLEEAAA